MIMLTKMRELCEQVWCSQLVANHYETDGDDIRSMLRDAHYKYIVDWPQTWIDTPQGDDYWSAINGEWRNNH